MDAGVKVVDIHVVAEHLKLSVDAVLQTVLSRNDQVGQVWGELLKTWRGKDSDASWEKLATAIENISKDGVSKSEIVRKQSRPGAHLCNFIVTAYGCLVVCG